MPKVRKDNKGRNLRPGETQRSDGSYMFVYSWVRRKSTFMILTLLACGPKKKFSTVTAKTVFAPRRL